MSITLAQAPVGVSLTILHITDPPYATRLARLGLYEGARFIRLNESVTIGPAKVRTAGGDAVLAAWLAGNVVMHLDDDRRLPLLECPPGASGHVEGVTGRDEVERSLLELGIRDTDRITFLRRLPPMVYTYTTSTGQRGKMSEGLAAHILGDTLEGRAQFSSVGVGEIFRVRHILPGEDAKTTLNSLHIEPGTELSLTSVAVAQNLNRAEDAPIACQTQEGLRLYFREADAAKIVLTG